MGGGAVAMPGNFGVNVTGMVQTDPAATVVVPAELTVQPVMVPMVYSEKLGAMAIEVMGTAIFTVSVTFCEVDLPTAVDGKVVLATVKVGPDPQACGVNARNARAAVTTPRVRWKQRGTPREGIRKPTMIALLNFGEAIACKPTIRRMGNGGGGHWRPSCPAGVRPDRRRARRRLQPTEAPERTRRLGRPPKRYLWQRSDGQARACPPDHQKRGRQIQKFPGAQSGTRLFAFSSRFLCAAHRWASNVL